MQQLRLYFKFKPPKPSSSPSYDQIQKSRSGSRSSSQASGLNQSDVEPYLCPLHAGMKVPKRNQRSSPIPRSMTLSQNSKDVDQGPRHKDLPSRPSSSDSVNDSVKGRKGISSSAPVSRHPSFEDWSRKSSATHGQSDGWHARGGQERGGQSSRACFNPFALIGIDVSAPPPPLPQPQPVPTLAIIQPLIPATIASHSPQSIATVSHMPQKQPVLHQISVDSGYDSVDTLHNDSKSVGSDDDLVLLEPRTLTSGSSPPVESFMSAMPALTTEGLFETLTADALFREGTLSAASSSSSLLNSSNAPSECSDYSELQELATLDETTTPGSQSLKTSINMLTSAPLSIPISTPNQTPSPAESPSLSKYFAVAPAPAHSPVRMPPVERSPENPKFEDFLKSFITPKIQHTGRIMSTASTEHLSDYKLESSACEKTSKSISLASANSNGESSSSGKEEITSRRSAQFHLSASLLSKVSLSSCSVASGPQRSAGSSPIQSNSLHNFCQNSPQVLSSMSPQQQQHSFKQQNMSPQLHSTPLISGSLHHFQTRPPPQQQQRHLSQSPSPQPLQCQSHPQDHHHQQQKKETANFEIFLDAKVEPNHHHHHPYQQYHTHALPFRDITNLNLPNVSSPKPTTSIKTAIANIDGRHLINMQRQMPFQMEPRVPVIFPPPPPNHPNPFPVFAPHPPSCGPLVPYHLPPAAPPHIIHPHLLHTTHFHHHHHHPIVMMPGFTPPEANNALVPPSSGNSRDSGTPEKKDRCAFCKSNGERETVYMGHVLRDPETNMVVCPQLRKFICPLCGATGDNAHTQSYCPQNANGAQNRILQNRTVKHLKALRPSAGKLRATTLSLKNPNSFPASSDARRHLGRHDLPHHEAL